MQQLDIEGEAFAKSLEPRTSNHARRIAFAERCRTNGWPDLILAVKSFQEVVLRKRFPDRPTRFTAQQKADLRVRLEEEIAEFTASGTIADDADALVDLVYFALGGLHQMGVRTEVVFHDVHRANVRKVAGRTKRGQEDDAAKPDDWTPPDHSWLDEEAGMVPVGKAHGKV